MLAISVEKMSCNFCENIFERNRELGLPEEESIVYEDENIYVMPDISPLIVGHMLIVSKKHYQGYAGAKEEVISSVKKFLLYYGEKIGYRDYTIFEHGAVISYHAGASIDHAHMHIVPLGINMGTILDRKFSEKICCNLEELSNFAKSKQSYLYYKRKTETTGHAYPVGKIPSQYLRDVANQLLSCKKFYDWKLTYRFASAGMEFCNCLAWWDSLKAPVTFKWAKKLILEKYGLTEYKDLLIETVRYSFKHRDRMFEVLEKILDKNEGKYYRIILVPLKHQYKLPNFLLMQKEDIASIRQIVEQKSGYQEIWCFSGNLEPSDKIFSGRISYNWMSDKAFEFIEVIEGDSPRLIEKYTLRDDNISYLRVSRESGETYQIDINQFTNSKQKEDWMQRFTLLEKKLKAYDIKLNRFKNMVRQYGISSLCLDFKMIEDKISFIDWDTSNDERIIKNEKYS